MSPPSDALSSDPSLSNLEATRNNLLAGFKTILDELTCLEEFLVKIGRHDAIEFRGFRKEILTESKGKIRTIDFSAHDASHVIRSSNLPFYEAVWKIAKSTRGLVAVRRRFYWDIDTIALQDSMKGLSRPQRVRARENRLDRSAVADIVARDGTEWIKISTVTEKRLLFEMAKLAWNIDSDYEDEDREATFYTNRTVVLDSPRPRIPKDGAEDSDKMELIKMAEDLRRAASANRVRCKLPEIRFVLLNITEGRNSAIDSLIATIRAMGVTVDCLGSSTTARNDTEPKQIDSIFADLLPSITPPHPLTPTLNLDTSILIALISDISHFRLEPQPTFHRLINDEIIAEASANTVPSLIYPALSSRVLVCSTSAANKVREIASHMGTATEKARADILLGEGIAAGKSDTELRELFGKYSVHPIPCDKQFPVSIIREPINLQELPEVATELASQLKEPNRSVFLLGWAKGWTTMTHNRTVARQIEFHVVEKGGAGCVGPDIWVCGPGPGLIGKPKGIRP